MPPMTSVRTFIAALRTGETRTTQAVEQAVARRRGARAEELVALLHKRGALKAPLDASFRDALRDTGLPPRYIDNCIDGWPDGQKEEMRRAMVTAINGGHRVRFAWGLTAAAGFETEITRAKSGTVTIRAMTPRSALRASADGDITAMPKPRRKAQSSK